MKIKLSCDDACASDVRLAELATKYNVECVFYWPVEWHTLAYSKGYKPLSYDQALDIAQDFDIGSHTITHRLLTKIPIDEAKYEIEESLYLLREMFDTNIEYFAPPRGYTNDLLTEFTLKFYEKQRLTKGEGLVHVHPDSGANGNVPWLERAKTEPVDELWMHSWELDKYNEWDNLERYFDENSAK